MGNIETNDSQNQRPANSKLIFVENVQMNGVGSLKVFKRGIDEYAISLPVDEQFDNFTFKSLEARMKLQHPHLMKALGIDKQANLPSQSTFFYEYSFINLESLISERLGTNKLFPEEDLSALIKGISSTLQFLQQQNITNGDISPSSIYFDVKTGVFKIFDKELIVGMASGYNQAIKFQYQNGYFMSPEMIEISRQQGQLYQEVIFKSDIFSLGMCVLEAATLQRSIQCYDQNYSIIAPTVQERLMFIRDYYSPSFYNLINTMLAFDFYQRPDPIQFMQMIDQQQFQNVGMDHLSYQQNIRNVNQFQQKPQMGLPPQLQNQQYQQMDKSSPTKLRAKQEQLEYYDIPLPQFQQPQQIMQNDNSDRKDLPSQYYQQQPSQFQPQQQQFQPQQQQVQPYQSQFQPQQQQVQPYQQQFQPQQQQFQPQQQQFQPQYQQFQPQQQQFQQGRGQFQEKSDIKQDKEEVAKIQPVIHQQQLKEQMHLYQQVIMPPNGQILPSQKQNLTPQKLQIKIQQPQVSQFQQLPMVQGQGQGQLYPQPIPPQQLGQTPIKPQTLNPQGYLIQNQQQQYQQPKGQIQQQQPNKQNQYNLDEEGGEKIQNRFQQNIQQIKDEIAKSKQMIENYQKNFESTQQPPYDEQQQPQTPQQFQGYSQPQQYQQQQLPQFGKSDIPQQPPYQPQQAPYQATGLEERISNVIARSQQIRQNYN